MKQPLALLISLSVVLGASSVIRPSVAAQSSPSVQAPRSGALRQIIPGHFVYSTSNAGRIFRTSQNSRTMSGVMSSGEQYGAAPPGRDHALLLPQL